MEKVTLKFTKLKIGSSAELKISNERGTFFIFFTVLYLIPTVKNLINFNKKKNLINFEYLINFDLF